MSGNTIHIHGAVENLSINNSVNTIGSENQNSFKVDENKVCETIRIGTESDFHGNFGVDDLLCIKPSTLAPGTAELVKQVGVCIDESEHFLYCVDPGRVVIINNEKFENQKVKDRKGSQEDVKVLRHLFEDTLGWEKVQIHTNLTKEEIDLTVRDYAMNYKYDGFNSFFLFVMSHGSRNGIFGTDCKTIKSETILEYFSAKTCNGLVNKPKIFVFQACRGDLDDNGVTVQTDGDGVSSNMVRIPYMNDFIVLYPCIPGYTALRTDNHGTAYIQTLAFVLKNFYDKDSLHRILTRVSHIISQQDNNLYIKMLPCQDIRLTKKCYFKKWFKEIKRKTESNKHMIANYTTNI